MSIKNRTYQLTAIFMALLMFVTSVGFAVDMHYCKGELKSFSFFGKAKSCHELQNSNKEDCPHHKKIAAQSGKDSLSKRDCCSNKTVYIQSDQDQKNQVFDIIINKQLEQFIITYTKVFLVNDFTVERESIAFTRYEPPSIARNIPILNQTFLL